MARIKAKYIEIGDNLDGWIVVSRAENASNAILLTLSREGEFKTPIFSRSERVRVGPPSWLYVTPQTTLHFLFFLLAIAGLANAVLELIQ